MERETALTQLTEQGERRAAAKREAANAMDAISRLARAAHQAGAHKTEIAEAAQISRPTLDEILR